MERKLWEFVILYGAKIIGAIIILVAGRIAVGIIGRFVRRLMTRGRVDETMIRFVVSLARIALMVFVIIAALGMMGVRTASFVAVIGAAGLAVSLAMQGSLANFAFGVMLIISRQFKTGDYVETAGAAGTVEAIQIFNTILKTPGNKKVIVPNSKITGDNIINYSANDTRRIGLVFGIGYGDLVSWLANVLCLCSLFASLSPRLCRPNF